MDIKPIKGLQYDLNTNNSSNMEEPKLNQPIITPIQFELPKGLFSTSSTSPKRSGYNIDEFKDYFEGRIDPVYTDIVEERALNQSTGEKWANATGKMALTAGITFLDGTLGTVWGLGELMAGGSFINNKFSNAMADIFEWQEKVLPNYYSKDELDNPWYTNLGTANFWADKVFKNLGFAVGAMYSGAAWAGGARALMGTTKLARNVAKGVASKFFNGNVDDALLALQKGEISSEQLLGELAKDAKFLKNQNFIQQVIGSTTGAIGESRIEAINNAREFEELHLNELDAKMSAMLTQLEQEALSQGLQGGDILKYVDNRYNQEKEKLKKVVNAYRNSVFLMNAIVLSAGNALQFGKTFSGGYSNVKKAKNLINKVVDGVPTNELQVAKKSFAQKMPTYFKDAFIEGHEELVQGVIKETGDEFYTQKINPKGDEALKSYAELFANQYISNITNPDKWEEFVIGAFTGFLGTPSFGTGKMWSGGVFNTIAEDKQERVYAENIANKWNAYVASDRYKNMVRSLSYEQDKSKAIEEGNEFEYKNAENGQFVADIVTAIQADKFDEVLDMFEGLTNAATPEQIKEMYKVAKDATGNEIPINERKGIFDNKDEAEIKKYFSERSRNLIQKAKEVRDIADKVELKFGNSPQSVKETLTYYLSSIKDSEKRIEELNNTLSKDAVNTTLVTPEITQALVESNGVITKDIKKSIEITKKVLETIERNNPDTEVLKAFEDLIKLEQRRINFVNLYEKSTTPEGLEKILETQKKFDNDSEEILNTVDAKGKFTDGKELVDKKTGENIGTLRKVGDEWRLIKYNEFGEVIGETIVNPTSKEFIDTYDVFTQSTIENKNSTSKNYLNRETGEEVIVSTHPSKEGLYLAKNKKNNTSWELNKEQLDEKFVYKFDKTQETKKTYKRNSDGKTVIAIQDVQGNYRIKEQYTDKIGNIKTRYEEISKEELNKNYTHLKTYEKKQSHLNIKNRSIKSIKTLIEDIDKRIANLDKVISPTDPVEFIRQEIKVLQTQLDKGDKRQTQQSVQKIVNKINELSEQIDVITDIIVEQEKELETLNNERDILYSNLQRLENWEEGQAHPIRERITEIEERIKDNNEVISACKKIVNRLKEVINTILESLGLSHLYKNLENVHDDRKLKEYRRKRLNSINESLKKAYNPIPVAKKLQEALNQIEKFEKENDELLNERIVLDDIVQEYRNLLKQEALVKYLDPSASIPYLATVGSKDNVESSPEENILSPTQLEQQEKNLREDRAMRHPAQMFTGLRGRHYMDDEDKVLNPDKDQQRYYNATNNLNLNSGKYKLKLEFKKSNKVTDKEYSNPLDKTPIAAYIVDENGAYIDEFGKVTTKENGIFSYMPSIQYPSEVYKPIDWTEQQLEEFKTKMTAEYKEAKTKIIAELEAGNEVVLPIVGKSQGVPRTTFKEFGTNNRNTLNDVVQDINSTNIIVATANFTNIDGKVIRTKPGFVYVKDTVTGNILPVTPRKLNKKEINNVVELFKLFVSQAKKNSDGTLDFSSAGTLKTMGINGKTFSLDKSMFDCLGNILFWTQDNLTEDAKKLIKNKKITREEALANSKYWINKNDKSKQAFYFVPSKVPGGSIRLGQYSAKQGVPLMQNNGREWVMHNLFEEALRKFLETQHVNINSIVTNDNRGFTSIKEVKKTNTGEYYVEIEDKYSEEGGYQQWMKDNEVLESRVINKNTIDKSGNSVPQLSSVYIIFDHSKYVENEPQPPENIPPKKHNNITSSIEEVIELINTEKYKEATTAYNTLKSKYAEVLPALTKAQQTLSEKDIEELNKIITTKSKELLSKEEAEERNRLLTIQKLLTTIRKDFESSTTTTIENTTVISEKEVSSNVKDTSTANAVINTITEEASTKEVLDYDPNIDNAPSADFMFRPAKNSEEIINTTRAVEWLNKVLGDNISTRISTHMLSGNNWGSYRKGIITLFENAGVGTEFHEAFHAITDLFLNDNEKNNIFNSYRELTNKKGLTDKQVEEELAEDFANYMLGNIPSYLSTKSSIVKWFSKLFNFIKKMFTVSTISADNIQDLFEAIDKGKFAKRPLYGASLSEYSGAVLRGNLPGLSVYDKKEILEGINAIFFNKIFFSEEGLNAIFSKKSNALLINTTYSDIIKNIGNIIANKQRLLKEEKNKDISNELTRQLKVLITAHANFNEVVKMHREFLLQYDLEFVEDTWNKDVNENDRGRDSGQSWGNESLKSSSKYSAGREIKLLLGSIPLVGQKNKEGLSKGILNSIDLPMTVDFGQGFNILINKLAGLTDWNDMQKVLLELSNDLPWVWTLGKRLGIDKEDSELTSNEILLRSQFQQTMAKHNNEFYISTVQGNKTTIVNSNQNSFDKRKIREWSNNAKTFVRNGSKFYKINTNGDITYNKTTFENKSIIDIKGALLFLEQLGIKFSNETKVITLYQKEIFNKATAILGTIKKGEEILIFQDEEGGNAYEDLRVLAGIERKTTIDAVENSLFNIDGHVVYGQTLNNYLSLVTNELNKAKNLEELFEKLPHLKSINSSLILNRFKGGKTIGLRIHEGTTQKEYSGNKKPFDDLKVGDRLREILHNYEKGNYALLRPADNSIERFLEIGKFFTRTQILGEGKHLEALLDYLVEELNDMTTLQRSNWNFVSKNANKGVVLDMIKEVDSKRATELTNLVNSNGNITEYINSNKKEIIFKLNSYLTNRVGKNKKLLLDNLLVEQNGNNYTNHGLPINKENLTNEEINNFIEEFTVNALIANIEQVKLFSGNPMFYKSVEDQFKRNSGQVGTKKISIVSEYMNNWIKNHMDNFGLSPFTNTLKNGQPILKTAILADVKTVSAELDSYKSFIGESVGKYDEMDEADAQGYIHLSEYRRMLMRAGDWTFGKGSLEEKYQQQIGRTTYLNPKTGEELFPIELERVSKIVFSPLKPQHFGPLAEGFTENNTEGFIPGFYKLSVLPILPKVAEQFPNMGKLNKQMELQGIGLVVFASGNKVGTKLDKNGSIQPVYDKEGKFNFNKTNKMITQDTYYKYWGIQVDMGNKNKKQVIWGTQMAKHVINSLTEFGKPKTSEASALLEKYLNLNKQRIELGFEELLEKFGLEYDKDNNLVSKNPQQLIDTLKEKAIADNMPDNIILAIEDIDKYGIDISPNRKKLEQVLMAMADKIVISQKTFGAPLVQVANTFFEKSGIRQVVKKNKNGKVTYYQSNELRSYGVETNGNGNITKVKSMQVMIPAIYKGIVDIGKLSPELLKLIGFRIPTQGLNSIESLEIVGFLPEEAGDIIVLPTEIVAKAGSDFDIDKMSVFFPNVYKTKNGEYRYIKNSRTQWETYQLEGILEDKEDKLLTWGQWQKKGVENELMEVMNSIITSPMNAQQLLSPNQVEPLKEDANYIEYLEWKKVGKWTSNFDESFLAALKKENDATPYNKIIDLDYQIDLAERFLGGKSAIGITAVHSTFHILSQMNNLFIKSFYAIEEKVREGKKLVTKEVDMPTKINMEHNNDENGNILLGGLKSKNGDSIVEELSMWINAAVDAAKDPFMFKLNAGPQTLNVVLFLAMSGVSRRNITLFMGQPIIKRYLELQRKYESIMADSTKVNRGKKYKNEIEDMVLNEMDLSKFDWSTENIILTEDNLEKEFLHPSKLQAQILSDFMRYQEVAKVLREAVQSVTYDTAGAGKTTAELGLKLQTTDYILAQELIGNYNKLLDSGFIAPYYQKAKVIQNIMKEFVPHLKSPIVAEAFKQFMDRYIQPHVNMKNDDVINAVEKFKEDLLVYIVMTTNNNANQGKPLQNEFDRLFKGDTSMANRISELQKKYPRNTLLANLLPIFNSNTKGINNVKMYITKLETIESNQLTEDWRALYEGGEREFAKDLIKFIIIQSGLNNSPLNFINLAPHEYYAEIMNSITTNMNTLTAEQLKDFGGDIGQFWLHHRNDKTIVPTRKTKGFPYYRSWSNERQSYDVYRTSDGKIVSEKEMPILDFKNNSTAKMYGLLGVTNQINENTQVEDRPKKNISTDKTIVTRISEGLYQITSGMWDKVIEDKKLNKAELIKELTNAKTNNDIANILKKIC